MTTVHNETQQTATPAAELNAQAKATREKQASKQASVKNAQASLADQLKQASVKNAQASLADQLKQASKSSSKKANLAKSSKRAANLSADHFALREILEKHNLDGKRVRSIIRSKRVFDDHKHNSAYVFLKKDFAKIERLILDACKNHSVKCAS